MTTAMVLPEGYPTEVKNPAVPSSPPPLNHPKSF